VQFESRWRHNSGLEQVDFGAPVHLALDNLQAVDLALDLTAGPGRGDRGGNGILVGLDPGSERSKLRCLVPAFDGVIFSHQWKDALWDRFCTGAPARQRQSVEQYNIVKRA
jgi:hypothetical protein